MTEREGVGAVSHQDGFGLLTLNAFTEQPGTRSVKMCRHAVGQELVKNHVGGQRPVLTHLLGQLARLARKSFDTFRQLRFFLPFHFDLFLHFVCLFGRVPFFNFGDLELTGQLLLFSLND